MLLVYNKQEDETSEPPFLLLIIEDCFIELCDENRIGKDFSFVINFKSTGRSFYLAADNFKSLGQWVSLLTITPIDYINLSKQSFLEQIEQQHKKVEKD
uniref:PH domain-containing protein n=1 Tax=Caenorhabditis tropicalis TaxID=1561998 RepID=A0A1I7UPD9_9PELO